MTIATFRFNTILLLIKNVQMLIQFFSYTYKFHHINCENVERKFQLKYLSDPSLHVNIRSKSGFWVSRKCEKTLPYILKFLLNLNASPPQSLPSTEMHIFVRFNINI